MVPDDKRLWYYFGCHRQPGHHLFDKNKNNHHLHDLEVLDGALCLKDRTPYIAVLTRLPHLNYSALAWWDYTVDRRSGSNSIIFVPSLITSLPTIRVGMEKWFSWVEKRLPRPLVICEEERVWSDKAK